MSIFSTRRRSGLGGTDGAEGLRPHPTINLDGNQALKGPDDPLRPGIHGVIESGEIEPGGEFIAGHGVPVSKPVNCLGLLS